jgi:molybdopterin biosynthesis enzyme MoaB
MSPRDLTPEATRRVIEREAPGLAEAMRSATFGDNPHGMLSRGVSGVSGPTLIVNLPGSVAGVEESLAVIGPGLRHAVALLRGETTQH